MGAPATGLLSEDTLEFFNGDGLTAAHVATTPATRLLSGETSPFFSGPELTVVPETGGDAAGLPKEGTRSFSSTTRHLPLGQVHVQKLLRRKTVWGFRSEHG